MSDSIPTAADLSSAINLLSVLELAKDATSLKTALQSLVDQTEVLAAQQAELETERSALVAATADSVRAKDAASAERSQADIDISRVAQGFADLAAEREAMKVTRAQADEQAAGVRQELADARALVDSDRDQVDRRERVLAERALALDAEYQKASDSLDAANAKGAEYDAKLANLKGLVA